MTKKKIAVFILIILILLYLIAALIPSAEIFKGENPLRKGSDDMPILVAHRGGAGEFPGNTLEAFYNAYSVDERAVFETDVSITRDGVLILCHDTYLDDFTNVTGDIADWSYSDLVAEQVDFGYNNEMENGEVIELLPYRNENGERVTPLDVDYPAGVSARHEEIFLVTTLDDLLTAFPDNIVSVEIKQDGELGLAAHAEALRIIDKHDAWDRVIVASFHGEVYRKSLEEASDDGRQNGMLVSPSIYGAVKFIVLGFLGIDSLFTDKIAVLQLPVEEFGINIATKRLTKAAHSHNLAIYYWTVNDEEEMRMLVDLGVDGITTDYPHRLKAVYESYNK